jgi:hypothetical protein
MTSGTYSGSSIGNSNPTGNNFYLINGASGASSSSIGNASTPGTAMTLSTLIFTKRNGTSGTDHPTMVDIISGQRPQRQAKVHDSWWIWPNLMLGNCFSFDLFHELNQYGSHWQRLPPGFVDHDVHPAVKGNRDGTLQANRNPSRFESSILFDE